LTVTVLTWRGPKEQRGKRKKEKAEKEKAPNGKRIPAFTIHGLMGKRHKSPPALTSSFQPVHAGRREHCTEGLILSFNAPCIALKVLN